MVINKHGSFYLRNGWGTKILHSISQDDLIFTPSNEQNAIDNIGLGRVMIKALRYWSVALGLTTELKTKEGIRQVPTELFQIINQYDLHFQNFGSLLLLHRNLARNLENATAWYWVFNEYSKASFSKIEFVEGFNSYLAVNGMNVKKTAVEKEYNCLKNTYIVDKKVEFRNLLDDDIFSLLAPLGILMINDKKECVKRFLSSDEIPLEVFIYSIAMDNIEEYNEHKQISLEKLLEEKLQVGKYYNMKYSTFIEMLLEAENKKMISLSNNFGNRYMEFTDTNCNNLIEKYYINKETL